LAIFYICPWAPRPTGGIKQIFRHVEALNNAGFDAYVLALESKMPSWFDSSAAVARVNAQFIWSLKRSARRKNQIRWLTSAVAPLVTISQPGLRETERRLGPNDIIVLPEYFGKALQPCGFGSKLVVFNQNAHYTFAGFTHSDALGDFIYQGQAVAALAVSKHTSEYLKFAFRGLRVFLTPNGVDGARFFPPKGEKKKQIAFMPRKLPNSIVQVLQILRSRGSLDGWALCPIDGLSEADVAASLRDSAIFLSTCHDEGFGLPPLEAGASGCVVVGYTGYAASEFMLSEYCYPIAQGDVLGFARTLERVMAEFDADPQKLREQAADYAEFIRTRYSKELESSSVVDAWNQLCGPIAQRRAKAPQ